jgi:exosortase
MALGPILALGLALFVYRPLFLEGLRLPASSEVEHWLFMPEQESPLLAIGIAGWLLWRRRASLLSLPDRSARAMAVALLAVGMGLLAWSRLTGEAHLLLPSLAANLLAFASAAKGRAGCRVALLPALVLLLGVPIPAPLRDPLVWRLQLWTARGAAWLLERGGADVVLRGVQIQDGGYTFTVIESCSGLRGIEILTLVAVAIRELFAASGWRPWLVVLLAPWLGFALNVLRVVAVVALASSADPAAGALEGLDHTPQGLAVLVAGTGLLYALGRGLGGTRWRRLPTEPQRAARPERSAPDLPRRVVGLPWRGALGGLAALGAISVFATPFPRAPQPAPLELPERRAGWSGEDRALDRAFVGPLRGGEVLHRRYQRALRNGPIQVVDLLVGYEVAENRFSRFFSPKLLLPGHDWSLTEIRRTRVWALGLEAEVAVASRDSERALVYVWRLRDGGVWRESSRAALALERGPFRREPRRAVVRVATPVASDGSVARDRAKRTLEGFIADFRDELAGL